MSWTGMTAAGPAEEESGAASAGCAVWAIAVCPTPKPMHAASSSALEEKRWRERGGIACIDTPGEQIQKVRGLHHHPELESDLAFPRPAEVYSLLSLCATGGKARR